MREQVVSIGFLALLVIVPVGIVVLIVLNIVRGVKQRSGIAAAAQTLGWQNLGSGDDAVQPLAALLEPTLFAMQPGCTHRVSNVFNGRLGRTDFTLARYNLGGQSNIPSLQRAGVYRLVVIQRETPGQPFWLFAPRDDVLGAVAARLAQGSMKKMEDPSWSWALISSTEALGKMHMRSGSAVLMKDAVEPGGSLFFFPQVIVLLGMGDPDGKWAKEIPGRLQQLTKALST